MGGFDTACSDEGVNVRWVDADMLAEFGERDAAFGDEPADEPGRGALSLGGFFEVEQWH
jgi:hypothetical protein